jgi:hypothetical protein
MQRGSGVLAAHKGTGIGTFSVAGTCCSVGEVHAALDGHPSDRFLVRTLALELMRLDELEETFRVKAHRDQDTAAGALLVKIYERRAILLGLNPPQGRAAHVVQHPPVAGETNTDKIERVLQELIGPPKPKTDEDKLN